MNAKGIIVVRSFDRESHLWTNNRSANKLIVDTVLEHCYEKFKARGYLFLNEVYSELGLHVTAEGQVAGWIYSGEYMKKTMWTVWMKPNDRNVYITFEPLENILHALPHE